MAESSQMTFIIIFYFYFFYLYILYVFLRAEKQNSVKVK